MSYWTLFWTTVIYHKIIEAILGYSIGSIGVLLFYFHAFRYKLIQSTFANKFERYYLEYNLNIEESEIIALVTN